MIATHGTLLLLSALCAVIGLILLIAWAKLNPFIVIFLISLALAIVTGMPLEDTVKSFEAGLGGTLGHIAIIIGLGTMLGKMMAESGGAERIAQTLIQLFGERWVPWSMMLAGLIVGLPVFFEVGFVLLVPIAFTVARRTGKSPILIGLPLMAGLSVVHGLVPPHPAAMLAVTLFHADVGRTIFYALLIGIPTAIVAGPLYAMWVAPKIHLDPHNPIADQFLDHDPTRKLPGFGITLFTVLLPVVLMLLSSWTESPGRAGTLVTHVLQFLGNADIALLAGVIVSFFTLGQMRGFTRETILRFCNESLAPTATITLLVGAGGGFGRILQDSGVSRAIVDLALHAHLSILLLGWVIAALIRLAVGSSTVAMATAAGIVAPVALHVPGVHPELLSIAVGAGSLVFSHVSDGGFWLVKEYFNMTVADTLKTWSICETIISVVALALTLLLSMAIH
ncbi:MAG TPA: gluconate:H+ symporter [Acidobacteriaceae bacterium]|nr:gluconate:H+ symporter [Acidobacteriaceae bacterium]